MKRNMVARALIFLALFLIGACGSDTHAPAKMLGWAVGMSEGGYGTILHTKDGGKTWTRQGDAAQLPDAGFSDICVLEAETLLVVWQRQSAQGLENTYTPLYKVRFTLKE